MAELKGAHAFVCVCGGIAAYKAAEVVRGLQKAGVEVRVAATEASLAFVGAATWEGLTHTPTLTDIFAYPGSAIPHIELSAWADVCVVVPATADVLAKMRMGLADDAVSTTLLALPEDTPLVVAPAMNVCMWRAAATQENVRVLKERGVDVVLPVTGRLACDEVGEGKLAPVNAIVERTLQALAGDEAECSSLAGRHVVVTAGPTHEAIDSVRYIANASSGKMGFALAAEAARRGAQVTLVAGPVSIAAPESVTRVDVVSAADMHAAASAAFVEADVAICAAAVADYTPVAPADHKLKKATERLDVIRLTETVDILADLSRHKDEGGRHRVVVGFAAETNDLIDNASAKLTRKGCDLIVANDVSRADSTFGSDTNRVSLVSAAGVQTLSTMPKSEVAGRILDAVEELLQARGV